MNFILYPSVIFFPHLLHRKNCITRRIYRRIELNHCSQLDRKDKTQNREIYVHIPNIDTKFVPCILDETQLMLTLR